MEAGASLVCVRESFRKIAKPYMKRVIRRFIACCVKRFRKYAVKHNLGFRNS